MDCNPNNEHVVCFPQKHLQNLRNSTFRAILYQTTGTSILCYCPIVPYHSFVISCSTQLQLYPSVALPTNWDVPVDLFFHRDVEELKKNEDEIAAKLEESQAPAPVAAPVFNEMPPEVDANLVAAATGFNAAQRPTVPREKVMLLVRLPLVLVTGKY